MSEDDKKLITWNDADSGSRSKAISDFSASLEAYGSVNKSRGSHSNFLDIESKRSVRPGFDKTDYYAFRSEEQVPVKQKRIMKMCMDAYDKVGIIRNVIDLMGDFGSQGISIVHENKSVEKFYKQWFKKIDGKERSERFLNILYKCGNVLAYRSNAKITPEISKFIKSMGNDIKVKLPDVEKNVIPWRYNFFNPLTVEMKDGAISIFLGRKNFQISTNSFLDKFSDGAIPANILDTLPPDVKQRIKSGEKYIPLDPDRLFVCYYKKDDWNQWANPMIYAILDDIIMLEKMRLADMSALDGAISNIRLWTLGDLEHKILPNKAAINKLRDILASNVGGGTMELVWGPELSYAESNSQVYKFLGSEKYQAVLNSIYAGLGVPPTLTGMAGQSGGFTNNFISLKTLVERLQYGRDQLIKFWEKEVELVRRAMGFRKPAHIIFDQMSLSDESSEKNLLIQLADRDIISQETILERFKEIPSIEKIRLKREMQDRDTDKTPSKASPYHNPQHDHDLEKIALQQGVVTPEDVGVESSLDSKEMIDRKFPPVGSPGREANRKLKDPKGGRPKFSKDTNPRKKRVDTPKSKPGVADLVVWTQSTFDKISEITTAAFLGSKNKNNMRKLTKSEIAELESIKLDVLTNVDVMSDITPECTYKVLSAGLRSPKKFRDFLSDNMIDTSHMQVDEYRKRVVGSYIEFVVSL